MGIEIDLLSPTNVSVDLKNTATQNYILAMERLLVVVQELSLARSLQQIMDIVRVAAREITQSDGASFVLRDNGYCYYAEESAIAPLWKGRRFPMNICIGGWAMFNRQPAIIDDVYADERVPYAAYQPTFIKSMVMVPIRSMDPVGAIGTYWANHHQPTKEEVILLQALADTTAVAMENVQIYQELEQRVRDRTTALEAANTDLQQEIYERKLAEAEVRKLALTDDLTNLYNRRGFFLLAEQQLKLAQRSQTNIDLLFIDLDGLKTINDTFGHEMGDIAIVSVANLLKETFRTSDIIGRLGGDEFAILTQVSNSHAILQRMQANIHHYNHTQQLPFQISMSIGVQSYDPARPISLDDLVTLADTQMYQQKRAKGAHRHL
jgi:diguanylate cyclase (GGDEF)-like protein